ncbi:MAG TPA: hypothetical protein VI854_07320, partial [Acidimicrobiia bacterium]|nr:hypothetical protein [Acidimicrobiia bacterium]
GDDDSFLSRSQACARLAVSMAGRAAEEMLLDGDYTHGASGDIASATDLATRMVTAWGMSRLGVSALDPDRAFGLGEKIHAEVESLVNEGLERAREILREHRGLLEKVVAELLDEETIDLDRMRLLQAA